MFVAVEGGPWDQVEVDLVLLAEDVADFEGGVGSFRTSTVVAAVVVVVVAARLFPLQMQMHKPTPLLRFLPRRPHRGVKRTPRRNERCTNHVCCTITYPR
jgi:hypothetical protein